jgi:hypothetical protein
VVQIKLVEQCFVHEVLVWWNGSCGWRLSMQGATLVNNYFLHNLGHARRTLAASVAGKQETYRLSHHG